MSIVAIINGAAGGGACGKHAPASLNRLRTHLGDIQERWTEGPEHATELVRDAWQDGARQFISVGGDGTAYEVLNGLFPYGDERPTLGYLPLGTGNSFVRDFGVTDPQSAESALIQSRRTSVDVVQVDHDDGTIFYVNLFSVGFSAQAGDVMNRRFKPLGAAGYIAGVLVTLARLNYPVFPVRLNGRDWDRRPAALLSFSNSGFTGGTMNMAPGADASDGRVDVVRVGALPRGRFLRTFPKIFAGTHTGEADIELLRAKRIELDLEGPVPCMVDGEVITIKPRLITVLPGALEVML